MLGNLSNKYNLIKRKLLVAGCWALDVGYSMLDVGCSMLDTGY